MTKDFIVDWNNAKCVCVHLTRQVPQCSTKYLKSIYRIVYRSTKFIFSLRDCILRKIEIKVYSVYTEEEKENNYSSIPYNLQRNLICSDTIIRQLKSQDLSSPRVQKIKRI